jgi:hypothetical protein
MVPEPPGVMVPEPPVTVPDPPPPPLAIPVIAPSTPAIEHDGEIMEKHYRRRRATRQQMRMRDNSELFSADFVQYMMILLAPT